MMMMKKKKMMMIIIIIIISSIFTITSNKTETRLGFDLMYIA
jgi:hypothetical protein